MTSHRKVKSVAKVQVPSGPELEKVVLKTMKTVADLVGSTLGPGGKVVAIERQEFGIPDLVTKDGVTVFRNLGFHDPVAHSIMGLARDASVRTASEAGDGTTTATVLAEAFVRYTYEYCKANPKVSPQRVVRTMEKIFRRDIEPYVKSLRMNPDAKTLRAVAMCSTNGDEELTGAVAKCFELTGDEGNVTITETSGPSGYRVEAARGYTADTGFEDSIGRYFAIFINDQANSRVHMEKPVFILYHGVVTELATIYPLLKQIGEQWGGPATNGGPHNIVVVATGFSDRCIEDLAANWKDSNTLNIYPVVTPKSPMQSGQYDFLADLSAVTGSVIFDPVTRPVQKAVLADLGPALEYFEATRYKSNFVGQADEGMVLARMEEIEAQLPGAESEVETKILNLRKAKLSGGVAKLFISAPTNGELREKRDRADDAVCAWRGAAKYGALPGGGWALQKICMHLSRTVKLSEFEFQVYAEVVFRALLEPVKRLLQNCGYTEDEINDKMMDMSNRLNDTEPVVFDALEGKFVAAKDSGVIDSLPAVLEALRNSLSIASQLGTLGGIIVFPRDAALEREQASDAYDYYRAAGMEQ
jgi:chaperonin GroEL